MFPARKMKVGRKGVIAGLKGAGGGGIGSAFSRTRASKAAAEADEQNGPRYRNSEVAQDGSASVINSAQSRTRASKMASDAEMDHGPTRTASGRPTGGSGGNSGQMRSAEERTRASRPQDESGLQHGPTWTGRSGGGPSASAMSAAEKRTAQGMMATDDMMNHGPIRAAKGGHVQRRNDHDADDRVKAPFGGFARSAMNRMSSMRPASPLGGTAGSVGAGGQRQGSSGLSLMSPAARSSAVPGTLGGQPGAFGGGGQSQGGGHPSLMSPARPQMPGNAPDVSGTARGGRAVSPSERKAMFARGARSGQSPVTSGSGPGMGAPRGFGVQPGMGPGAGYAKGGMALGGKGRFAALTAKLRGRGKVVPTTGRRRSESGR